MRREAQWDNFILQTEVEELPVKVRGMPIEE